MRFDVVAVEEELGRMPWCDCTRKRFIRGRKVRLEAQCVVELSRKR